MLMIASFVYGGFLIFTYLFLVYFAVWGSTVFDLSASRVDSHRPPGSMGFVAAVFSPVSVFILAAGILCILNGLAWRKITHQKVVEAVRVDLSDKYLSDEEKEVIEVLENARGDVTQKELTVRTGYNKVKIHRVLQKLESKELIQKVPYGQTNKIVLKS